MGILLIVFKSARKLWTVCCFLMTSPVCKYFEGQHCPSLGKRPRITDRLITRELWLQFRFSISTLNWLRVNGRKRQSAGQNRHHRNRQIDGDWYLALSACADVSSPWTHRSFRRRQPAE